MALGTIGETGVGVSSLQPIPADRLYGDAAIAGDQANAEMFPPDPDLFFGEDDINDETVAANCGVQHSRMYNGRDAVRTLPVTGEKAVIGDEPSGEVAETNPNIAALAGRVAELQAASPDAVFGEQTPAVPLPESMNLTPGRYLVIMTDPELYFAVSIAEDDQGVDVSPLSDPARATMHVYDVETGARMVDWIDPSSGRYGVYARPGLRLVVSNNTETSDEKEQYFSVHVPSKPTESYRGLLFFSDKRAEVQAVGVVKVSFADTTAPNAEEKL